MNGTLFKHVISDKFDAERPMAVVDGVPIFLHVSRDDVGRFFVECTVSGFSSPFVTVHELRADALHAIEMKLQELLAELRVRIGPFVDNPGPGPTTARFEFDGRILHAAGDSWLLAGETLRRQQDQLAAHIEN